MQAVGMLSNYITQGVSTVSGPFHPFGGAVDVIVVQERDGTFKTSPWYVKFGKFQGVLKSREKIVNIAVNDVPVDFHMYLDHTGEAYFLKEVEYDDEEETMLSPPSAPSSGDEIIEYEKGRAFESEVSESVSASVEVKQGFESLELEASELIEGNSAAIRQGSEQHLSVHGNERIERVAEATRIGVSSVKTNEQESEMVVSFSESSNVSVDSCSSETMQKGKTVSYAGADETEIPRKGVAKPAKSILGLAFPHASERLSSSSDGAERASVDVFHRLTSVQRAEIVADLLDRNWGTGGDVDNSVSMRNIGQIDSFDTAIESADPQFMDRKFLPQSAEGNLVSGNRSFSSQSENLGEIAQIICGEVSERHEGDANPEEKAVVVESFVNNMEKTGSDVSQEDSIVIIASENNAIFPEGLDADKLSEDGQVPLILDEQLQITSSSHMKLGEAGSLPVETLVKTTDSENVEVVIMSVDGHIVKAPVLPHDHQSPTKKFDKYAVCPASQTLDVSLRLEDSKTLDTLGQPVSPLFSHRIMEKPCLHDSGEPSETVEVHAFSRGEKCGMSSSEPGRSVDVETRVDSTMNNFDLSFNDPLGRTVVVVDSVDEKDGFFESSKTVIGESSRSVTEMELPTVLARKKNDLSESRELAMAAKGDSNTILEENTSGLREPLVYEPEYEALDINEAVTTNWVAEEEVCKSNQARLIDSTVFKLSKSATCYSFSNEENMSLLHEHVVGVAETSAASELYEHTGQAAELGLAQTCPFPGGNEPVRDVHLTAMKCENFVRFTEDSSNKSVTEEIFHTQGKPGQAEGHKIASGLAVCVASNNAGKTEADALLLESPTLDEHEHFHSFRDLNEIDSEADISEDDPFKSCLALEDLSASKNGDAKVCPEVCSSNIQAKTLPNSLPFDCAAGSVGDQNGKPCQYKSKPISIPQINGTHHEEEDLCSKRFISGSLPASFFETEKFDGKNAYSQSVGSQPLSLMPFLPDSDATVDKVRVMNCISSSSMDTTGLGTGEELERQAKEDTLFENGRDAADSQEIVELAKTCNTGIEISLCRHLLSEGMGIEAAAKAFASEIVSFEEYESSRSAIISSDKLVVKIGERYFPWVAAAPVILGIIAFGMEVTHETPGAIAVEATEAINAIQNGDGTLVPSSGRWRLWPFTFRRSKVETGALSSVSNNALLAATEAAIQSHYTEELLQKHGYYRRPRRDKERSYVPTSQQLASLNLKDGSNNVMFTFSTRVLGKQQVDARIYLWKWNTRIVISDVDGTITKSDVLGQFMPLVGKDWTQSGVTRLFSAIKDNGYELLFLSARAISQAHLTRQFLVNLKQDGETLPGGPVVISPDGLFPSFYREVIRRAPHEFKISCLEAIRELFPPDVNPFYAGFGNRDTDEISYLRVGIPKGKIFIINPKGEVVVNHRVDVKSYTSLHSLVDDMFPPMSTSEQEDFNSWNFWKMPLPDIDDELNDKGNSNQRAKRGGDSRRQQ